MIFTPELPDDVIFFSRSDPNENFGTFADYSFELDDKFWPTVEHYYQTMKFTDGDYQERVRTANSPTQARKRGRKRHKSFRKDWRKIREIVMTRALYTRCKTYPVLTEALLDTGERKLVENSSYDYFWGCGRDRRGENTYGKVLTNVRTRLREEIGHL